MDQKEIMYFIEAALLAAAKPLSADQLKGLFDGRSAPDKGEIRKAVDALNEDYAERGIEIADVASGYRMQVKASMADRLQKLWEERPPRYSRALFETLALVAYRQPITRGEIEDIRGVSVSSNIVRTLMERDWVRVVGHRDVPGRPAMFGTTKTFLDYFGLKKLEDLPPLADLADWESLRVQLDLPEVENSGEVNVDGVASNDDTQPPAIAAVDNDADPDLDASDAAMASDDIAGEAEVAGQAEPDDEPATAQAADAGDEELVVSEWPDPTDAKAIATLETRSDDDRDASAGGS